MDFEVPVPSATTAEWLAAVPSELTGLVERLRNLIYRVAFDVDAWPLVEELKWGQPSYRSPHGNESTPVRLGLTAGDDVALLTHCQSSVVPEFRAVFGERFRFEGDRAVLVSDADAGHIDELADFVGRALTYRRG
ncbi:MAG: DUF1801 domain-containing protein [Actinomycetota bacterium]